MIDDPQIEASLSKCIPDYLPVMESFKESTVLPTIGFLLISLHLSSILKMSEWKMLFSIERDGTAFQTFYSQVEEQENTVIIIKDENDEIFGCFNAEQWRPTNKFYGNGQSFLFKFDQSGAVPQEDQRKQSVFENNQQTKIDNIEVFFNSNANLKYQHSDEKSLTVGGSDHNSGASSAIYVSNFFKTGMCYPNCQTFEKHPRLASQEYFKIK